MDDDFDQKISEDDNSNSDCDNSGSETESDDTSTDEYITYSVIIILSYGRCILS